MLDPFDLVINDISKNKSTDHLQHSREIKQPMRYVACFPVHCGIQTCVG